MLALGIIVAGVLVAAWVWPKAEEKQFDTATAAYGTVVSGTEVTGNVRYKNARNVAFMVGGKIDRVEVAVGDTVNAGEVLASLRDFSEVPLTDVARSMQRVVSPISGVVTAVYAAPGEIISPGAPVVTVEGPRGQYEVVAYVSENDIVHFFEGQDVATTVDAIPEETFTGEVVSIAPKATAQQGIVTYEVVTTFATDGKGFENVRAGMSVTLRVEESAVGLMAPSRAVLSREGEAYVRVVDDTAVEGYREQTVATGLRGDDGNIVITDGLAEGDEVVVRVREE